MKNKAERTPRDRNEKRRLLLNKKYEIGYSLHNETETAPAAAGTAEGVIARVSNLTKKQLRALIAVLVAVAVVLPGLIVGIHVLASDSPQGQQRYVNELVTNKTVEYDTEAEAYKVRLESYTTSEAIAYPATDIVLVLDLSGSMNNNIGQTEYVNLNTHTGFKELKFNTNNGISGGGYVRYNDLYDSGNIHNAGLAVDDNFTFSDLSDDKYIEDPNTPGIFIYVACHYGGPFTDQKYQLFATDSKGNEYATEYRHAFNTNRAQPYTFNLVKRVSPPEEDIVDSFTIDRIYSRQNDNSMISNILPYAGNIGSFQTVPGSERTYTRENRGYIGLIPYNYSRDYTEHVEKASYSNSSLYIYNDEHIPIPVTVEVERVVGSYSDWAQTKSYSYVSKYYFTATDGDKTYQAVYGNAEYGAQNSVFQGFKSYQWKKDPTTGEYIYDTNGKHVLEVVHENSLESKSLYRKVNNRQNITRLQTMKEAVEQFVIDVHSNAFKRDIDQRIAVVTFNNGATTQVSLKDVRNEINTNAIIDSVYNYTASNGTQIQAGMRNAYNILSDNESRGRNKVVVAFTDGVPTLTGVGSTYSTDAATSAITYAHQIEGLATPATSTAQATTANVYSIGLFTGADSNQMHGSMYYHSGIIGQSVPCSGEVRSEWGRTYIAGITNSDMSDVDAAATNRFLNLLSSNYRTATSVGITKISGLIRGQGFRITNNYPRTGDDYYFGTQSEEELYNAFKKIAEDVAIPETTLEAQTHLYDTVTESFNIVEGSVVVFTEAVDETGTTWDRTDDELEIDQAKLANKIIDVTGFDYSKNYLTAPNGTNPAGNYGKRVVVEFYIDTIDNFVGGNGVPTNGRDSGIYGSDWILVEDFEYPLKDIELDYSVDAQDQEIYLNEFADLMEMLNLPEKEDHSPVIDGTTNAFANIEYVVTNTDAVTQDNPDGVVFTYFIPAGESSDNGVLSLQEADVANLYPALKDNKTYHVTCNVTPSIEDNDGVEAIHPEDEATVYVYKPVVTVEDQHVKRSVAQQGVDLQVESIVWKAEGKDDTRTEADGAPSTTYKVMNTTDNDPATPINAYEMSADKDFDVYDFTIPANSKEYTADYLCYVRTSGPEEDKYVIASEYQGTPSASEFEVMKDEEGNIVYVTDEDGNQVLDPDTNQPIPIFIMETVSITRTITASALNDDDQTNGGFVTYINSSDPENAENPRIHGEFKVYVTKPFTVKVQKVFSGSYAVVDDVTITIRDERNNTVATHRFDANDFTGLSSDLVLLKDNNNEPIEFECDENYTVSETFADIEKYNVTYTATSTEDGTITGGQTGLNYTFKADTEEDVVNIVVTNAWNSAYDPVVTGFSENDTSSNILLIALAATATVSAGGYGIYRVYRPRKKEN